MLQQVEDKINFAEEEEKVLKFWNDINAFGEAQRLSKGRRAFSFYDGPPFATGLPHYGHILTGTIKDIVTRYAYQNGYHVERRFGWDCHGLPVEFEIDKKNGYKGPDDIEKVGIANYNKSCREIVTKYSQQWEDIVNRIGRWIDFRNDYKTMYPSFMESVWWVFSELWNKGLVYRGVKVMPYSTACCTPLSNFESGQNYKEVVDPAVVVKFRTVSDPNTFFLAWTTTPWTLPSNLALCVNPDLVYVRIKENSTNFVYILLESRLGHFLRKESEKIYTYGEIKYEVVGTCLGNELFGIKYIPLFPYFQHITSCFQVVMDGYVTSESGTGVVHQAPYFGEDDLRVCLAAGLITRDQEPICPINSTGHFTKPVTHFEGKYVKEADKDIIKHLKNENKIFSVGVVTHNYPFCWRSETPLIYRAIPSLFIRVEHMSQDLLAANDQTYWVPDFVKEKRFANWLKDARDWAVSRNRYWGTPIPLWVSEDYKEIVCVGSMAQLEKLTGTKIEDLHRESIDHLTIPSKNPNNAPLRRIPEIFDCWFESGSMPYAQVHFPFENVKKFNQQFPADFIAEGIDQTRGWFYTLLVISTALFNKAPFKNLVINGLVLAADGQKMSKSKKNFPDPMDIINKYGADALRLYLINSPVVRADKLRFREEGVRDVLKDVFLPWYNAYRFFIQNTQLMQKMCCGENKTISFDDDSFIPGNLMDKWIFSSLQSLIVFVRKEMGAYRLYTVIPRLVQFIDNLTNWYVRMNRKRLKFQAQQDFEDWENALSCLGSVLSTMARLMAPFTPFLTELMYSNLKIFTKRKEKSVHFVPLPQPRMNLINEVIENSVSIMQTVIDLGRVIRDRKTVPIKCPLREAVVILKAQEDMDALAKLKHYISEELNVDLITLSLEREKYRLSLNAEPNHKLLGPRLKSKAKRITEAIKMLNEVQIKEMQTVGNITIEDEIISIEEVNITLKVLPKTSSFDLFEANFANDVLLLLDMNVSSSNRDEGIAREVISRVQKLRKKAGLVPTDDVEVYLSAEESDCQLHNIITKHINFMENILRAQVKIGKPIPLNTVIIEEVQKVKGMEASSINIIITRLISETMVKVGSPSIRFVNVSLWGMQPGITIKSTFGSILLENPVGYNAISYVQLIKEVQRLFEITEELILKRKDGTTFTMRDLEITNFECLVAIPLAKSCIKIEEWMFNEIVPPFADFRCRDLRGTVLLHNPLGNGFELTSEEVKLKGSKMFMETDSFIGPSDVTIVR